MIEVQPGGSSDAWLTAAAAAAVIASVVAAVATVWVGKLNRRTGKEARDNAKDANENSARAAGAAERGAAAAEASAKAAGQSAQAATDAVVVNRELVRAAKTSAESSTVSSAAAGRAAEAATKAATTTENATAQLETWRQREETMRLLRWAVDHAVKAESDPTASSVGQITLEALRSGNLLQPVDEGFIDQVIAAIVMVVTDRLGDDDEVFVDDEVDT